MANYKIWEKYEIDFLIDTYHTTDIKHIAKELNRPEKGVFFKAHKLGLKNKTTYAKNKKKEYLSSLINSGVYDVDELSRKTGLSVVVCNKGIGIYNALMVKPKQVIIDYVLTEQDIFDSMDLKYEPKDLKGWELEQFNKIN